MGDRLERDRRQAERSRATERGRPPRRPVVTSNRWFRVVIDRLQRAMTADQPRSCLLI
jgi:hypothetical protein